MQDPKAIRKALLVAKSLANSIPADFINRSHKDVTKRIPEMEEGARKVQSGEMTGDEYQELVNKHKPVYPYQSVPEPATHEQMFNAVRSSQKGKVGLLKNYPEGHPVSLRLDIPAYSTYGVWVPTIHHGNKTIAHEGAAHISNATFNVPEHKAMEVATGKSNKSPFAVINGNLKKTSTEDIHKLAQQYLNHPDWRQVGMDPTRHGYFYDRHTQEPIEHAEEVLQVGPLVLAKKPVYGDKSKYKYASGGFAKYNSPSPLKPTFENALSSVPREKGTASEFYKDAAAKSGVKTQELIDRGLDDAYSDNINKINKQQAMDIAASKPLQPLTVRTLPEDPEREFGDEDNMGTPDDYHAQFKGYGLQFPDGKNYREKLYIDPTTNEDTAAGHWPRQGGVVAHARVQDRETPEGKRAMHIEEIQADVHQKGHKTGYRDRNSIIYPVVEPQLNKLTEKAVNTLSNHLGDDVAKSQVQMIIDQAKAYDTPGNHPRALEAYRKAIRELGVMAYPHDHMYAPKDKVMERLNAELWRQEVRDYDTSMREAWGKKVPDMPFKNNWHELVMKHLLHDAASEGYDSIYITPGKAQAERANKAMADATRIEYENLLGKYWVRAYDKNGSQIFNETDEDPKSIASRFGAKIADKMQNQEGEEYKNGTRSLDLDTPVTIGGEFHRNLYDKKIPNFLNSIGKKHGTQVRTEMSPVPPGGQKALDVMRPFLEMGKEDKITHINTPEGVMSIKDALDKYIKDPNERGSWRAAMAHASGYPYAHAELIEDNLIPELRTAMNLPEKDWLKVTAVYPKWHHRNKDRINTEHNIRLYASGHKTWPELKEYLAKNAPPEMLDQLMEKHPVHRFDITPSLRKQILEEGLPMYKKGGYVRGGYASGGMIAKAEGGQVDHVNNLAKFMAGSHPHTLNPDGSPKVLYHGSTADISKFDPKRAYIESDHGAGIYATSSKHDASENYAGEGPDLTNKIERHMDIIRYDADHSEEELKNIAREHLGVQHLGAAYPVYISMKNPVVLDKDPRKPHQGSTFFNYESNYDPETEEYGEPSGSLIHYLDALRNTADEFEVHPDAVNDLINKIYEHAVDDGGIAAHHIERLVKDHLSSETDPNTGDYASNEIWRRSLENAGFDGIIDNTVNDKFGDNKAVMGKKIKGMTGVNKDTAHYVAFHPNQIKSAIGNSGVYDPNNPDITKAEGGDVKKEMSWQEFGKHLQGVKGLKDSFGYIDDSERKHWAASSNHWKLQSVNPHTLEPTNEEADAESHKRPIIVSMDGDVLDGRHRRQDAISKGKKSIAAWVGREHPITKAEGGDVEQPFQQPEDTTPSRQLNDYGLYSHAAEAAEALKQEKGPPQQMIASLKGVKPDELYWSGVHDAFRDRKSITKQELADHFRNALPKYRVSTLTNDSGTSYSPKAKYGAWTAERKMRSSKQPYNFKNYREVLNQIDNYEPGQLFQSSHWGDPNIISHVRVSDRESMPPKPRVSKPKTPEPDSVVKRHMGSGDESAGNMQDTIAYSTPHKNIFITPSIQKRGKYVLTHGPSGRAISSEPVEFYHAMDRAKQLNEKVPHVFDFNDGDSINNFIRDPKNEKDVQTVRELIKSPPPDLPTSNSKKLKEFTPEKILHVEESQSDFGQAFRKHSDKVNEYTQELKKLNDQINDHRNTLQKLVNENPHLVDNATKIDPELGYTIGYREFEDMHKFYHDFVAIGEKPPADLKEKFIKDKENWDSIHRHRGELGSLKHKARSMEFWLAGQKDHLNNLPKFPYVDNTSKWTDLNVKRILTDAAKGNYDKLIWTPGSVQSKIYGIGNSYSGILYNPRTKQLIAKPKGRRSRGVNQTVEPEKLPEYIGEELTKRLLEPNEEFKLSGIHRLTGRNLDVPNPGQEAYYGKIFPRRLLELAREHDPEAQLSTHKDNDTLVNGYPALKITPKMRASILKNGFKAYKSGGYIEDSSILSAAQDPQKAIRKALMVAKRFSKKND